MFLDKLKRAEKDLQAYQKNQLPLKRIQEEIYVNDLLRHSVSVADIAKTIGEALNMPENQLQKLYCAALYHDIGKVSIPASILFSTQPLTEDEFAEIRKHPIYGAAYLEQQGYPDYIVAAALSHHERWDAHGYPGRFSSRTLPLSTRIISVADTLDAMQSPRVYRAGLSRDEIITELKKTRGTQLDPSLVDIAIETFFCSDKNFASSTVA